MPAPEGLGIMGLQYVLSQLRQTFDSPEAQYLLTRIQRISMAQLSVHSFRLT